MYKYCTSISLDLSEPLADIMKIIGDVHSESELSNITFQKETVLNLMMLMQYTAQQNTYLLKHSWFEDSSV